jgi:hypothetical protein
LSKNQSSHMGQFLRSSSSSNPPSLAAVHRRAVAAGWWLGPTARRHHALSCTMHTQSTGEGVGIQAVPTAAAQHPPTGMLRSCQVYELRPDDPALPALCRSEQRTSSAPQGSSTGGRSAAS